MVFVLALVASLVLTPLCLAGLHRLQALDQPNARSSHTLPTPRGGGVAVVVPVLALLALAGDVPGRLRVAIVVAGAVLALVGLADDLTDGLGTATRLTLALVAGGVASAAIAEPDGTAAVLAVVVAAVWVAGYLNAFNFMDGIDGISGVHGALAGALLGGIGMVEDVTVLTVGGWALAGVCLGFLPYNAVRARLFLGDVGSYGIGALIALLVVAAVDAGVPPEAAAGSLVPYLADTGWTLVQRVRRGERWHQAHRQHVFQQLTDQGRSHQHVTALVGGASAVTGGLGLLAFAGGGLRVAAAAAMAVVALGYLRSPTLLAGQVLRP